MSTKAREPIKKIALVTWDVDGLGENSGLATLTNHTIQLLNSYGLRPTVFVLRHSTGNKNLLNEVLRQRQGQVQGLHFVSLQGPQNVALHKNITLSYNLMNALLEVEQHWDLILYPDMFGIGYFTTLAKRLNLAFQGADLVMIAASPIPWVNEINRSAHLTPDNLADAVLEKHSMAWSDRLVLPTRYLLKWLRSNGYKIPKQTRISPLPFYQDPRAPSQEVPKKAKISEIVFFGRLESRKGLENFLLAIRDIRGLLKKKGVSVTLLGKPGFVRGIDASWVIDEFQRRYRIRLKILPNLNRKQSHRYCDRPEVAAVVASQGETFGYAALELSYLNCRLVCSDAEASKEVLRVSRRSVDLFDKDDPQDLSSKLKSILRSPTRRQTGGVQAYPESLNQRYLRTLLDPSAGARARTRSPGKTLKFTTVRLKSNSHVHLRDLIASLRPGWNLLCPEGFRAKGKFRLFESFLSKSHVVFFPWELRSKKASAEFVLPSWGDP